MITLEHLKTIEVEDFCRFYGFEELPCEHRSTVTLKDGRVVSNLSCFEICDIVSKVASDKINPNSGWTADGVREHFQKYACKRRTESLEVVLSRIFFNIELFNDEEMEEITLNHVETVMVFDRNCLDREPCHHESMVILKDGRKSSQHLSAYEISSIVSNLASEKINPGNMTWNGDLVKDHFEGYDDDSDGWEVESPEVVLNRIFLKK